MQQKTPVNNSHVVRGKDSTTDNAGIPVTPTLPPHEIERICRAFIRLITAQEIDTHATTATNHSSHKSRRVTPKRKNRHVRQSSDQSADQE